MVKGCVYFFRHIGLTPVKIGYTENSSPLKRFDAFKTYAPYGSELLGFIQTNEPKKLETLLHQKYSNKRIGDEWFEITGNEVEYEIDFHSKIEDVRDRNEFQQAWAKHLHEQKDIDIKDLLENRRNEPKEKLKNLYKANKNICRMKTAEKLGVTRQTIHRWINEIERG